MQLKAQVVYDVDPNVEAMNNNRRDRIKSTDKKITGYRVFVGFSSKRAEATEILKKAELQFNQTYGTILIYDEPNFKVYVGAFTTANEADAALSEIKKEFFTARKLKMQIPNPNYENINTN